MNVAFHLRRRGDRRPAAAAFLPGRVAADLLGLCARLGLDPAGKVFAVAGGVLVAFDDPTPRPTPGAVRLRALAENLYLPADADLVPALLDDEAAALARDRGLVFLPGGRVLGFDPSEPLAVGSLLLAPARPSRDWRPLPDRPRLADRIEEILVDRPDETPESVIESGGDPIATEPPRPGEAGPASNLIGRAAMEAGKGVERVGRAIGSEFLAGLGAGLIGKAVRMAPRLSEDLVGRQAAALRDLLRQFREGDVERALRRAVPLGEPGEARGAGVYAGDRLPTNAFLYDLAGLLGGGSDRGGGVAWWLGGGDVMADLTREYRKAAEEALRRGDYRRAAAIYGKLLRDYRAAAHALSRGGLHHDAAVLFLARLNDRRAAALAFESAGEFDRAVALYREVGEHVAAGDLLRRIGEEDAALAEYAVEAGRLAGSAGGALAAGNFLRDKVGRPGLALPYYAAGWSRRPAGNAVSCALALALHHADAADLKALTALVDEADGFFGSVLDPVEAGRFYNELIDLAGRPALEPARDDLGDRALTGLAAQVRRQARPGVQLGRLVSDLLGTSRHWPAPVVHDAAFAVAAATRVKDKVRAAPAPAAPGVRRLRVGVGVVTAVAAATDSDEIFLGFERGEVYCFRPERSEVTLIASYELPVASLATDPDGVYLVILRDGAGGRGAVSSYYRRPGGSYQLVLGIPWAGGEGSWLTPIAPRDPGPVFGLWDGQALHLLDVDTLAAVGEATPPGLDPAPLAALVGSGDPLRVLTHDGPGWVTYQPDTGRLDPAGLPWAPGLVAGSPLRSLPMSWSGSPDGVLDLVGTDKTGGVHWARLDDGNLVARNDATVPAGYLAAALVRGDMVAAVGRTHVEWLRCGASRFTLWKTTAAPIPTAVACVPSRETGELVVVCKDGFVARLPVPGL